MNLKVKEFYSQYIFRKLRFGAYIGKQITDAKLINNIKERYGRDPSKILIGVGDWSGGNIVKYQRPYLKSKTFCKMFQRAGFPVVRPIFWLYDDRESHTRHAGVRCGGGDS